MDREEAVLILFGDRFAFCCIYYYKVNLGILNNINKERKEN